MESLIIFIIFIVFSVLRSLGESQQKQKGRGPVSPPARPVRPGRPLAPSPRPIDQTQEYEDWVLETDSAPTEDFEPEPVRKKPVRKKQPKAAKEQLRPAPAEIDHYAINLQDEDGSLQMDQQILVQGIIFSEVLGAPRSKKPWRPRQH
ncbi:hypothetical protein [Dethiobacter alkaliphilus]|uniref:hypothetical protein n=1 Tax=Dethiobacter alkaliphilus TaxID=427926 RepID=UPI0022264DE5|nr:hypothetical protein [Dethiobacter alkaliphilus]MCW3489336.1 hypothetical protein [Dethiobacter alkaliphilus]